jgi:hypothetical protein
MSEISNQTNTEPRPPRRELDASLRAKWRRRGFYIRREWRGYTVLVPGFFVMRVLCSGLTLDELEARMAEILARGDPIDPSSLPIDA